MICPSCGTPNEAGRKFCGECGNRLAVACPSCGTANAPGSRFCGECGNPLPVAGDANGPTVAAAAGLQAPAVPVAERRLVTVLFADLVGFTSLSEGRDPEEVRELLSRYFDATREQIERYGGTVEKFIGDAVMAVWGAPTAHEDDAERAVRSALEIVDAVKTLAPGLQARAGVLSGEAAVTVGARGQGMVAGDLVNTASRLQSAAQPGMVLVGESTQRATSNSIAYEPAGEHELKGKATPVTAYRAVRVVAERGGRGRGDRLEAPFVGRDTELRLLKDLFHATGRERRVRLVSITGQGGIGKSRLTWELKKYADGVAEEVWWHEGRSPAYGSGVTFWALGEMVRARAEINETDDPATTRAKLETSVARFVPNTAERERVERALQALLGVSDTSTGSSGELFGAWRLFFERMAGEGLLVMVFEDLHWADPGLLDFIDHMLEWSRNVPIMIVTLARPELLELRPDWGAGRRNFLALDLEPLSEAAMRELLDGFVPGLSAAAARSIVARAEGIPLYAVETIRMLVADGRLRERAAGGFEPVGELGELAVPDTLHALIAARLDNLDPAERSLIQDAAVLGQSFTPAGLAAVSGLEPAPLEARLRTLVKSDLLVEDRDPRSPERGQYAFVQALIREVAYSTLSLKDRRARHVAAARFFESLGDDELAGALAAHYLAAFRATTDPDEAAPLAVQARIALRGAAERAEALGSLRQAISFFAQALEVAEEGAERADLLERIMHDAWLAGEYDRALDIAPELRALRESLGDRSGAAKAVAIQTEVLYSARRRDEAVTVGSEALREYEDLGDDPNLMLILGPLTASAAFTRDYELARSHAERGMAVAERLGMPGLAARILMLKGAIAQFHGRLWEAIALTEGAKRLAESFGIYDEQARINTNLANLLALDDPAATAIVERESIEQARRMGRRESEVVTLGNMAEDVRRTGEWDSIIGELEQRLGDELLNVDDILLEAAHFEYRILRGQATEDEFAGISARLADLSDIDVSMSVNGLRGDVELVNGNYGAAAAAYVRFSEGSDLNAPYALPKAGVAAVLARDAALAQTILDRLTALGARGRAIEADMDAIRAGLLALQGEATAALAAYRDVRGRFSDLGLAWDVALLSLSAASVLGTAEPEVGGWLTEARQTFQRLQARPFITLLDGVAEMRTPAGAGAKAASRDGALAQAEASSPST